MAESRYALEFYADENGDEPVLRWLREDLSPRQRQVLGIAMNHLLQQLGAEVCATRFGKQLGRGLFEFRIDLDLSQLLRHLGVAYRPQTDGTADERILLRVFCHAYGDRIVLLLGGYDKGRDPNKKRQQREIATARRRLTAHRAARAEGEGA